MFFFLKYFVKTENLASKDCKAKRDNRSDVQNPIKSVLSLVISLAEDDLHFNKFEHNTETKTDKDNSAKLWM